MSYSATATSLFRRLREWWFPVLMSPAILAAFVISFLTIEPRADEKKLVCNALMQTLMTTHDTVDLRRAGILVRELNCSESLRAGPWLYDHLSMDSVQKLAATFAFIIGGFWVLMNYRRNRTHEPRLQVEVTAELVEGQDCHYLLAKCTAKNVGLSLIEFPQGHTGSALVVTTMPRLEGGQNIIEAPWEPARAAFDIFTEHGTVEPALTIYEDKLIYLGVLKSDAYRVQLTVSAGREQWTAVAVTPPPDPAESTAGGVKGVDRWLPVLMGHAILAGIVVSFLAVGPSAKRRNLG
jgi:hypothetical protein